MSDINLDFTVSNNSINFTVEPNDITFTPTDIQLNIYSAGAALAGGANGTVQFNSGGILGGSANFTYDGTNAVVSMTNANINNLTCINNANLGNVSNVHITGGSNGYFLRTDGTGNLTWATGSLAPGGVNTAIQFNNSVDFGGSANLTFNFPTSQLNLTGNMITVGNITSNYFIGNGSSLTSIAGANVTGTVANANYALNSANINSATYAIENISLIGAQTGTFNFDLLGNVINFSTANATANLTLNFRGNSSVTANALVGTGKSITATYLMTTGANAYGVTAVQIDGSAQTIRWVSNIVPVQGSNTRNSYTFTLIKTSNAPAYTVLGSSTRYG